MNDEALRAKQGRAARVKELSTELFPIFDAVEKNYTETLLRSAVDDTVLREKVYHRVNALRDVRRAMELVIAEGASATAIIAKMSKANTGRRVKVS
jgi:hypothetical protein